MFLGKLVFLGLALLPVVAFGLILKNILFDKDKIMPTIEDWKEVGLSDGVDMSRYKVDVLADDFLADDFLTDPAYTMLKGNIFHYVYAQTYDDYNDYDDY